MSSFVCRQIVIYCAVIFYTYVIIFKVCSRQALRIKYPRGNKINYKVPEIYSNTFKDLIWTDTTKYQGGDNSLLKNGKL